MAFFGGRWRAAISLLLFGFLSLEKAAANPALVVDVDSGAVLYQVQGAAPWFPASLTKLMTTYVALSAVREGRVTLDTPLMVSPRAASMAPSKMGFRPGTLVTLDNALKMLMVKSPNDIAVTIAEGIGGSVEGFRRTDERLRGPARAARIAFRQSERPAGSKSFQLGPRHGDHRARACCAKFPEEHDLFGIGELGVGKAS